MEHVHTLTVAGTFAYELDNFDRTGKQHMVFTSNSQLLFSKLRLTIHCTSLHSWHQVYHNNACHYGTNSTALLYGTQMPV